MPRTPPSQADQDLIRRLAARGVRVTAPELERWRSGGYLASNTRTGLGRGAGSRSETAPGVVGYLEALASLAGQGRSMHQVMLTLFMAGIVQPENCPANDSLSETYEATIRRAFQTWIDRGDKEWNRVAATLAADSASRDKAEDHAFAEAEKVAKGRVSKDRVRLENIGAGLSGTQPRTRAQLRREEEQALLSATGLRPAKFERDEGDLGFMEVWHNGLIPLDVAIFAQPKCETCASRTANYPTSPQGRRDILNSACFCQLNRARAIGGSVCFQIASLRNAAYQHPDDQNLQKAITLISSTNFRFFLKERPKLAPSRPESIVPTTLVFLNDCRWLRAGAALLTELALWGIPSAKGYPSAPAAVARAMTETLGRARILRGFEDGVAMLLIADGLVQAAELLRLSKPPTDVTLQTSRRPGYCAGH